ncbi:glycosyltransferase family 4 protein [Parasphingopyxis algicola]|uniref:glycosyltransferase family 4 protein n=1 Tax=Parasphingopyxis algicola TaxID=2026624 RepID=UPI0015A0BC59|nr:glycosyltransferase family 4 protein [Parasphingopyxis algicola]QLC25204.1 glycosyltransferase family 4 protein [Parasphingopyxis algicola]
MRQLAAAHLLEDVSFGGVVKSLSIFDRPELATRIRNEMIEVNPAGVRAPRLDADIIITHFTPRWRTLPFLHALRLRNRKAFLVHVEHSYTRAFEELHVDSVRRFRAMLRGSYAAFDEVVAVSHGQADWLRVARLVPHEKLLVIPPWSDHGDLRAMPLACHSGNRPIVIGAYGRFDAIKGFDVLIDAVRRLDPTRFSLLLGGFGPEEDELKHRASLMPNMEFAGKVTNHRDFLGRCDIVAIPSRREAFGQVAMEAKLAGRPIIAAQVDGLPEQVGKAGITVDCSSAETLAAALAQLPKLPLDKMAEAARASVADAEITRLLAWQRLFGRAARYCRASQSVEARAAAPIRTSAGQIR